MILMPRQSDKECIPSNQVFIFVVAVSSLALLVLIKKWFFFSQLSSIGFVGFILAVINASMNIVNNANSNNNNRNNNNNENNDNNDNINIANLNSQQMNMQFVMAGEKEVVEKEQTRTKDQRKIQTRTKDEIPRSRTAITAIGLQGAQWSNWECGQVNNISRIIIVDIADCLLDAPPLLKRQTKAVMHKMRTLRNYELLLWIQSWRRLSWALVQSPISLHSLRACPCLPGWRWSEPWRIITFFLSESCLIIATMSRLPVRCLPTVTATTWSSDSTDSWSDPRWSQLDSL